jgi:RNA polymerase sigma-70 factor (ECF subfamily)
LPSDDTAGPSAREHTDPALREGDERAERELLARHARGDLGAFREIVLRTQAELVRYAARVLGSLPEAEDVVQEAYVKAHAALARGEFQARSRLRTWLYGIVTHGAIDALRGGRRRRALQQRAASEAATEHGPRAEARLALQELQDWLEGLPPEQRTALVLKVIEGHSSREVAEILGCSEGAVEQRLVRARAALAAREVPT